MAQEQITKLCKELQSLAKILDVHYHSLSRTGFTGTHPDDAELISSSIKTIIYNDLAALVAELSLSSLQEAKDAKRRTLVAIKFMNEMQKVEHAMDRAISTMVHHAPEMDNLYSSNFNRSSALTGTTVEDILKTQRAAVSNVERVKAHMTDPGLIEMIATLANPDLETTLAVDTSPVDFNLSFYAILLQHLIDANLHIPGVVPRVMRHVELLKSKALGDAKGRVNPDPDVPTYQMLVQTFRLIPSEPSMPFDKLIGVIFPDYKVKGLDASSPDALKKSLEKVSESLKNVGFIAWSKYSAEGSAREHHFRILTDPTFLEQMLGSRIMDGEGVSAKYITATDTLTDLSSPKKKVDFLITVKTDLTKYWVLLETLDGENFRFLKPWDGDIAQIPVYWFSGLIPAPKSKARVNIQAVPSPRVENYNVVLQDEILNHLHKPFIATERLTRDEALREDNYWRNLRTTIRRASMKDYRKIKGLRHDNIIQKLKGDKHYYENLVRHIAAQIENEGETRLPDDARTLADREIYLSSFQQMDKLRAGLAKTMESVYQELSKKKHPGSHAASLETLWEEVLEEGLTRYINRRSGIYITLDNKSEILRKCLAV